MDLNATAKLPDGTESRGAWLGWMAAGFVFGGFLTYNALNSARFIVAVEGIAESVGEGVIVWAARAAGLLIPVLTGVILALIAMQLHRRLLMPREVWLSAAALPAIATLVGIAMYGLEFSTPGITSVLTLASAWVFMRWREHRAGGMSNQGTERTPPALS
jgi:hypothetical protein